MIDVQDTISAIATPPGRGGVGIIRLSGPLAYSIALNLSPKSKFIPRKAYYVHFYNHQQQMIDDGIVLYFKAPHSFTGEDVIELQCHGAPVVLDQLLRQVTSLGARLARPGEFSERAFLNQKMDLTQAEAVADLINASSETAAQMAVKSLQGEFSKRINQLNEKIIHLRLFIEATLDFPDEEIDFLADGKVLKMLEELIEILSEIRKQASQGVLMREGLSVVIAGPPNAGKSTLINQLARRDIAIVTAIPGTTRDVMREHILIDDLPVHIIDTAGLRESDDPIEQEGIRRAKLELKKADCILWVTDSLQHDENHELLKDILSEARLSTPVIRIMNKSDLLGAVDNSLSLPMSRDLCLGSRNASQQLDQGQSAITQVYLSALTGEGLDVLKDKIKEIVGYRPTDGLFLARRRHLQALDLAEKHLLLAQQQLTQAKGIELLAEDLRLSHQSLSEITGEFTTEDLLGKIFSTFCIGK